MTVVTGLFLIVGEMNRRLVILKKRLIYLSGTIGLTQAVRAVAAIIIENDYLEGRSGGLCRLDGNCRPVRCNLNS